MAFGIKRGDVADLLKERAEMDPEDRQQKDKEESPKDGHLVDFAEECVQHTKDTYVKRSEKDLMLWEAHDGIMRENAEKESYQSKMTTNEPFTTVLQAKMLVRRAVMDRPQFFTIEARHPDMQESLDLAEFQSKALDYWTTTPEANFRRVYPAMCEMGFSVGLSMAVKALWGPDRNGIDRLRHALIPPWLIHRDPDARPQEPQSGLYCCHQDYVDLHVLRAGETSGAYKNIDKVFHGTERESAWSEEEIAKRKGQVHKRGRFRKSALVTEFWGDILDENGEVLLPNHSFTIANGQVIRGPIPVPFPNLRWPIHQFAPIPSVLDFHGTGLYEGVILIWKLRNNLLNLSVDSENWRINQAFEVNPDMLMNPGDTELFPGAIKIRKAGSGEGKAYTAIEIPESLRDFQVMFDTAMSLWTNGSFVTELLKGEVGERKNITAHEVDLKIKQGMGVFEGIGKDVELGGVQLLEMDREVIMTFWDDTDRPSYQKIFGANPIYQRLLPGLSPEMRMELLKVDSDIKMSGVSELFEKSEMLDRLKAAIYMTDAPRFMGMTKDYDMLTRVFNVLGIYDVLFTKEEMAQKQALEDAQAQKDSVSAIVDNVASAATGQPPAPGAAPGKPAPMGRPATKTNMERREQPPHPTKFGPKAEPRGGI